jgi:hypothetical protein
MVFIPIVVLKLIKRSDISLFFFFPCGTRAWTQGLHLEPLHQSFFCGGYFWDRGFLTICPGWLRTSILLMSASWVARIMGVSHQRPARYLLIVCHKAFLYISRIYEMYLIDPNVFLFEHFKKPRIVERILSTYLQNDSSISIIHIYKHL